MTITRTTLTLSEMQNILNLTLEAVFPQVSQLDENNNIIGTETEYRPLNKAFYLLVYTLIYVSDFDTTEFDMDKFIDKYFNDAEFQVNIQEIETLPYYFMLEQALDEAIAYKLTQLNNPMAEITKILKTINNVVAKFDESFDEETLATIAPVMEKLSGMENLNIDVVAKTFVDKYAKSKAKAIE